MSFKVTQSHRANWPASPAVLGGCRPCRRAPWAKQPMSASRQEGENIGLEGCARVSSSARPLAEGATAEVGGGRQGRAGLCAQNPTWRDSILPEPARQMRLPPLLSPLSRCLFLAWLLIPGTLTSRTVTSRPQQQPAPAACASSSCSPVPGGPQPGEHSGRDRPCSFTSLGKPLTPSGPQSPRP